VSDTLVAPTITPDELETWPTIDPVQEGVAREAARLDRMLPDWYTRINISELEMPSCTSCILGQAFAPHGFLWSYDLVHQEAVSRNGDEVYGEAYGANACKPHWINEIEARLA